MRWILPYLIKNNISKSFQPKEGEERQYKDGFYKFEQGHWKKINKEIKSLNKEAYNFLLGWCWDSDKLRNYQNKGIGAIDDKIVKDLSQFIPKEKIKVYRAKAKGLTGDFKYKNKLQSYFRDKLSAQMLLEDMGYENKGEIIELEVEPKHVLVDMTLIPNYSDLDLISEVIVIKEGENKHAK